MLMAEGPASPGGGSHESGGDQSPRSSNVREQDKFLPIAIISRIMKKGVPANGKISKDAKETVQECVSEFISFITSEYVSFMIMVMFQTCVVCVLIVFYLCILVFVFMLL